MPCSDSCQFKIPLFDTPAVKKRESINSVRIPFSPRNNYPNLSLRERVGNSVAVNGRGEVRDCADYAERRKKPAPKKRALRRDIL